MLNRDYFSHYTPAGVSVIYQLERKGHYSSEPDDYHMLGENIAMGGDGNDEDTPEHLFTGLMNSEGHRANILNGRFEEVGVGASSGTYQQYDDISTIYTTVFGGS
jgi:serralysin